MPSYLFQHTYTQFKRYESAIYAIVDNYPRASLIKSHPLSPTTYIARIRDAVNSVKLNNHPLKEGYTLGDLERIFNCLGSGGEFVFANYSETEIMCGPRRSQVGLELPKAIDLSVSANYKQLDANQTDIFDAILLLKNIGYLTSTVAFVNVSSAQLAHIDTLPNVEFIQQGNETVLI
jgi:hypothetical protein